MSQTLTPTATDKATTGSIYLKSTPSPWKRQRISSTEESPTKLPSHEDLYAWTHRAEAVASCSIRDVFDMEHVNQNLGDFFKIGRVPCRTVQLVGMVIGVQEYEKRTLYSVDDGTAVIDCYYRPPWVPAIKNKAKKDVASPPPPTPKAIARVGHFVKVVGTIKPLYETRIINLDSINLCSPNDELFHTRTVRNLHKTYYSLDAPFSIPKQPQTPVKLSVLQTPSTLQSSPGMSVTSSPSKTPGQAESHRPPTRFRHPSRLSSTELKASTFRNYVKHYMDNSPDVVNRDDSEDESDVERSISISKTPSTPTKRSRLPLSDETPRPKTSYVVNSTPRQGSTSSSLYTFNTRSRKAPSTTGRQGFTLSYLRRVPELSLLAARVTRNVTRKQAKEEWERWKLSQSDPSQKATPAPKISFQPGQQAAKIKRLFEWAIVGMINDGSIIIWDGPKRPCPTSFVDDTSGLWKSNSTFGANSTLFSNATSRSISTRDEDEDALSDPHPEEEAYVSVSTTFLADHVEDAMKVLVNRMTRQGKPYNGFSAQDILSQMRKDDRWRCLNDFMVHETLTLLKQDGRAWCPARDKWDLTL